MQRKFDLTFNLTSINKFIRFNENEGHDIASSNPSNRGRKHF